MTQQQCGGDDLCVWNGGICEHRAGFTPLQLALITSTLCCGVLAFPFIDVLTNKLGGRVHVLLISGVVALAAAVTSHFAYFYNQVGLLIALRVVTGMDLYVQIVTVTAFFGEYVVRTWRRFAGSLFQTSTTIGILATTLIGFLVQNGVDFEVDGAMDVRMRFQFVVGINTICCAALCLLSAHALCVSQLEKPSEEDDTHAENKETAEQEEHHQPEPVSFWEECDGREWVAATCLPFAQQASGINSVISYAPLLAESANMAPLLGSFLITGANVVFSIVACVFSTRLPFRRTFLLGLFICFVADLLIAISLRISVDVSGSHSNHSTAVSSIVAFGGSLLFILGFASFLSTTYYPLASRAISSRALRDRGLAWALANEAVLSFLTNFFYPLFLATFLDQREGVSVAFFFFSGCSLLALLLLSAFLKKSADYQ